MSPDSLPPSVNTSMQSILGQERERAKTWTKPPPMILRSPTDGATRGSKERGLVGGRWGDSATGYTRPPQRQVTSALYGGGHRIRHRKGSLLGYCFVSLTFRIPVLNLASTASIYTVYLYSWIFPQYIGNLHIPSKLKLGGDLAPRGDLAVRNAQFVRGFDRDLGASLVLSGYIKCTSFDITS